ncbi:partner of bursicon-like [Saccostrea echinata]|uniref:partner of bursicon-like n=1 Tax=Saccostrea echinata TaxID=191078 RepID=UPI002A7F7C72|nr:partner of bursicon-like [Saccostrea echinata]
MVSCHLSIFLGFLVCFRSTDGSRFRSSAGSRFGAFRRPQAHDSCNTKRIEMDITRTMSVTYNGVQKTVECVARPSVNECEGVCQSKAEPNVSTFPDLKKDCKCCKEGRLLTRQIVLDECYENGIVLPGLRPSTSITEPADCACFPCRN